MSIPLRVLIIEDSEDDALLLLRQLRRGGYDPIYARVDTAEALSEVLDEQKWDIVIADYAMPNFSASGALTLLKQKGHDLPFIVVSGAIGEETAVALMKEGAHDFLTKTHLARLVPAIERELGDAKVRRERMGAEAALRESEEKFRSIFEESPIGIELYNADGYLLEGNKACFDIFGVSDPRDVKGFQLFEDPNLPEAARKELLAGETVRYEVAFDFDKVKSERLYETTKSGLRHLDVLISPLGRKGQGAPGGFLVQLQDITDRKQAEAALRKRTHDLGERVKELNCLYHISKLIERLDFSWEQVFQGIVGVIPSALQYPEVACARIVLENHTFETENFLETSWKLAKAIIVHGERIGYVEACYVEERPEEAEGPFLREERGLINAIAERLGRVLERKGSEENIRALSQQLMRAHEIESQKIASDLHDNLAQDLSTLKIGLDTLFDERQIISEKQRKRVFELSKKVQQSITVVRDLAYDLHPAGLQQLGLVDTLRSYCEDFAARYDKKVDFFSVGLDQAKLDFETQIILYRSVQEGLTNVRKHADAGHVTVRLSASFPYILLRIEDDGKGFDPEKRFESVSKGRHMGLLSMEQRVAYLHGEMIIDSRPMQGTKILIKFPCQEKSNE